MIKIDRLDHIVLTVESVSRTCEFYRRVLGMKIVEFGENRKALTFGRQKINLHQAGQELEPKAANAMPGSADLCLIAQVPMNAVVEHLRLCGVEILQGVVEKVGALGATNSVYFKDPDQNLIEVSAYL